MGNLSGAAANSPSVLLDSPLQGGVYDKADANSPPSPFEPGQGNTKVVNMLFDSPDDSAQPEHDSDHMDHGDASAASRAPADHADADGDHVDQLQFLQQQLTNREQQIAALSSQLQQQQQQPAQVSHDDSPVRLTVSVQQADSPGHMEQVTQLWAQLDEQASTVSQLQQQLHKALESAQAHQEEEQRLQEKQHHVHVQVRQLQSDLEMVLSCMSRISRQSLTMLHSLSCSGLSMRPKSSL